MSTALTNRQRQVYAVLGSEPMRSYEIAAAAGIQTRWRSETAAHYAIQLVDLGLAVKGGTRMFPTWQRVGVA